MRTPQIGIFALVPDHRPGAGGSVLLLQKGSHDVTAWEGLAVIDQEQVIGRTKDESIELEDKPPTSHVARTDQDRFGKIFRRNTPYGTVTDHGTMGADRRLPRRADALHATADGRLLLRTVDPGAAKRYGSLMDADRARELLRAERERIERSLAGTGRIEDGEIDDDSDPANLATDLYLNELDESFAEDLRRQLEAVERAEARLAAGTYGLSVESGEPIPDARLEILPTAELTADEERARER